MFKRAPERGKIGVSHYLADPLRGEICVCQQPHGAFESDIYEMLVWSRTVFSLEKTSDVVGGISEFRRDLVEGQRF